MGLIYHSLYKGLKSKVCLGEIYIQGPKVHIRVDVHDTNNVVGPKLGTIEEIIEVEASLGK